MKIKIIPLLSFFLFAAVLNFSCQKEARNAENDKNIAASSARNGNDHGHLKQTKTYSSEVVQRWLSVQLPMLYNRTTPPYGLNSNRWMAYTGVALYEALVPGMPAYQSLSGQLNAMPEMPKTKPGVAYYWPASANAALAAITRKLFGVYYDAAAGDPLENELYQQYVNETGDAALIERSASFGKAVAEQIGLWSDSDRPWANFPAFTTTMIGPGYWPVPANYPNGVAYWGETRTMVPGSIDDVIADPPAYGSAGYIADEEEVYTVSKNLTMEQRLQAKYYDDPAALGWPAGASYYGILQQVLKKANPMLDIAAFTYAKMGISLMDATIGSFKAKFHYLVERPQHYLRREKETDWTSYIPTPGHPDYPSNHAAFSASVAYVLTSIFGKNFSFTNDLYKGKMVDLGGGLGVHDLGTRSYTSFYDMMEDISLSRLYGGIHTRFACELGNAQGLKTAANVENKVKFRKN
jgi:hypothetical protein